MAWYAIAIFLLGGFFGFALGLGSALESAQDAIERAQQRAATAEAQTQKLERLEKICHPVGHE